MASSSSFRVNARSLAVTYSQCHMLQKQQLFDHLLTLLKPQVLVVSLEYHQDSGVHYHVYARSVKKFDIKNPKYLDFQNIHPNIQSCKDPLRWLLYIIKEDSSPLFFPSKAQVFELLADSKKPADISVITSFIKAMPVLDPLIVARQYPLNAFSQFQKIVAFCHLEEQLRKIPKEPPNMPSPPTTLTLQSKDIYDWIVYAMSCNFNLPHKSFQIWIYGPTNVGKSSFAIRLRELFRVYEVELNSSFFQTSWRDDINQFAIIDEFGPSNCIQFQKLNLWLEGTPVALNRKFLPSYIKKQNIPTIILSNYHPREVYYKLYEENSQVFETLLSRIRVYEYSQESPLFPLIDALVPIPTSMDIEETVSTPETIAIPNTPPEIRTPSPSFELVPHPDSDFGYWTPRKT